MPIFRLKESIMNGIVTLASVESIVIGESSQIVRDIMDKKLEIANKENEELKEDGVDLKSTYEVELLEGFNVVVAEKGESSFVTFDILPDINEIINERLKKRTENKKKSSIIIE